jgi:D-alanyl-D-alanine carboxypeptidase
MQPPLANPAPSGDSMKIVQMPVPAKRTLALASLQLPTAKPAPVVTVTPAAKPAVKPDNGEGDIGDAGVPSMMSRAQAWAIQIGAFADTTQARNQLESYAKKSMDVLGQAARIVVPFKACALASPSAARPASPCWLHRAKRTSFASLILAAM